MHLHNCCFYVGTLPRWEISHLNYLARLVDFRPKDGDLQKLRATCAEKLAGQQQRQGAVGGVGQA